MKGMLSFIFILLIMPIGHAFMMLTEKYASGYLVEAAVALTLIGVAMVVATRWLDDEAWQTFWGILGGTLIWTGGAEYGFLFGARRLHVAPVGQTAGEYMMMEYTAGILLGVVLYLLYQESVRCTLALWLRRKLHLMRGPVAAGPVHNYGPRAAFEAVSILWFFYVLMLIAYDLGDFSWATYLLFILSIGGGIYMLYRLYHQRGWGMALRYAFPTVIVVWMGVEILGRWHVFTEPWIVLNVPFMVSVVLAFVFMAYLLTDYLRHRDEHASH